MAINPVAYTERIARSFLRYQLTANRFADKRLNGQMRKLLSLDESRNSPLIKGPYVSLSQPFRQGVAVDDLVSEGIIHPVISQRTPRGMTHFYGHQEEALRAIHDKKNVIISTGTGSGKTECFLYPIMDRCLRLADTGAGPGICAVIIYPMNALAEDQLGRLRRLLVGTRVPFGMYVGKTPESEAEVTGVRLNPGASLADYDAMIERMRREKRSETVHPSEECCSREAMRASPPRILLTNIKQLELLLTRQKDVGLFENASLEYLVFDEAHTYTGAMGAETACLTRRLRNFCGRNEDETICIATSATIVDKDDRGAAEEFSTRFFGIDKQSVVIVRETYDSQSWATSRSMTPEPQNGPAEILQQCVSAVDHVNKEELVRDSYKAISGNSLGDGDALEQLYSELVSNEIVYQISQVLAEPRPLSELQKFLGDKVGRDVTEEEILSWLILAAASRNKGRPLLRPVVHGFIRGIGGAVVSFPEDSTEPRLLLSSQDEQEETDVDAGGQLAHFPVTTCTTCGQHYFIAQLHDFKLTRKNPEGGTASANGSYWKPVEEAEGYERVVLTDQLHGEDDDETVADHSRTTELYFCHRCGAAHPGEGSPCLHCGDSSDRVKLFAIRQGDKNPGYLTSCISCQATGRIVNGRFREPARPVRATTVADVHVLAQDMVHHADRKRLLVFCDNRQDAAFQAGWMRDHARRFRMRALMSDELDNGALSVGDITHKLDELLEADEALSRALIPEVWRVVRKEGSGTRHGQERLKYLRIQVLREVTVAARQALGLEPWGRLKIKYQGLSSSQRWIQENADKIGIPPEELQGGVACILDYLRRKRVLFDAEHGIFTRYWERGDHEIQRGYLPITGGPKGTKLLREANEKPELVTSWLGKNNRDTSITLMVRKWGIDPETQTKFLENMFGFLSEELQLLTPVQLKGSRGRPLPGLSNLYQVNADQMMLHSNRGHWRCNSCSRVTTRQVPYKTCPAWRCDGELEYHSDSMDQDNYNLQLLDQQYTMLKPEEHTAMVPQDLRERLENYFKSEVDVVNCFACTPTLEIGIDIGALDAILMRNVPPLPMNYWQRSGRAGRRHRMAVNLTYSRPSSHDMAYFEEPIKLLAGKVEPPSFNMRNELMVAKHVHATMLTLLHQKARDKSCSPQEGERIRTILENCFPNLISHYLFEDGIIRNEMFDFSSLRSLVDDNYDYLFENVCAAFSRSWPEADNDVVSQERLSGYINNSTGELEKIVRRLKRRLDWAMRQIERLNKLRSQYGTLSPADDALFKRCDKLVKRMKGTGWRRKGGVEGFDDSYTFGVLAAEGYLPGYGLEIGSIRADAEVPYGDFGPREFSLPRPPSTALREYVPGNLIYANGNRFVPRHFHLSADDRASDLTNFEVSVPDQAVQETSVSSSASSFDSSTISALPICDVELVHQSYISDEEEFRFQMPVGVYGYERKRHNGGLGWNWGKQSFQLRKAVYLRLVNIGAASLISNERNIGYHVCQVCGQSVSPFSSEKEKTGFLDRHTERCGQEPRPMGFYADVYADTISLPSCESKHVAYSVLETLRQASSRVLDMHMDDLQVLVIGHIGREDVDAILWDTMLGGSGLLDQICSRFTEIVGVAKEIAAKCPSGCQSSCIDCLQTYRNTYYHKYLDRNLALKKFEEWGAELSDKRDIPPLQTSGGQGDEALPVNQAESKLQELLLKAGFGNGNRNEQIRLGSGFGTTTPDVIYRTEIHQDNEGVCIYLDGLSRHIHGNAETAEKDRIIRAQLRNIGYDVIEIAVSELSDKQSMLGHFRRLAQFLNETTLGESLSSSNWFNS